MFFFRCLFRPPPPPFPILPPDNVETSERAIDERILISETVKNQHCNGAREKSGNCPNSFDQDCRFKVKFLYHVTRKDPIENRIASPRGSFCFCYNENILKYQLIKTSKWLFWPETFSRNEPQVRKKKQQQMNEGVIFKRSCGGRESAKRQFGFIKDGAYYCYCAYVLRISRHSGFLWVMLINTRMFLRSLKLCGENRT